MLRGLVGSAGQLPHRCKQQISNVCFVLCCSSENSGKCVCLFYPGSALVAAIGGGSAYEAN